MDIIRPLLGGYADRDGYFRALLAAMPPDQQKTALVQTIVKTGPAPTYKKTTTTVTITADQWVAKQTKPFWDAIKKWYTDDSNQLPGLDEIKTALGAQTEFPAELKNAKTLEFYITHSKDKNDNKCGLCHKLSDDAPALASLRENAGPPMAAATVMGYQTRPAPTTAPSPAQFDTLPTGITSAPRRWYVNSVFDHSAHRFDDKSQRAMSCLECHAKAMSSEQMSDVLLPEIDNCVKCHHAADKTGPGAVDSCLACHPFYHDRSMQSGTPLSAMISPISQAQP
jgi:hypothetical protein